MNGARARQQRRSRRRRQLGTVTGTGTDDDLSGKIGLGARCEFANKPAIRAEYEFYSEVGGSNGGDVNYFGVSLHDEF